MDRRRLINAIDALAKVIASEEPREIPYQRICRGDILLMEGKRFGIVIDVDVIGWDEDLVTVPVTASRGGIISYGSNGKVIPPTKLMPRHDPATEVQRGLRIIFMDMGARMQRMRVFDPSHPAARPGPLIDASAEARAVAAAAFPETDNINSAISSLLREIDETSDSNRKDALRATIRELTLL